MAKFHIKADGMPGRCTATVKACPRGGDEDHFDSLVEAAQAIEDRNRASEVPTVAKKVPLVTRIKGAVEAIAIPQELQDEFNANPQAYEEEGRALVEAKEAYDRSGSLSAKDRNRLSREVSSAQMSMVRSLADGSIEDLDLPVAVRDMVWNKAWEDGHSSGYYEVYGHFNELAYFASSAYRAGVEDENIRQAAQ